METRGQLKDLSVSWPARRAVITLEVTASPEECERFRGKDLSVTVKQFHQHRSINANAYYWILCTKTARALRISNARLHNLMLRKHAYPYIIDGKMVTVQIPDTEEAENSVLEAETFHVKPTTHVFANSSGTIYRDYVVLKGSHEMDCKQFSELLDFMIEAAKEQGIETATPDQIARMKAELERNDTRRRQA